MCTPSHLSRYATGGELYTYNTFSCWAKVASRLKGKAPPVGMLIVGEFSGLLVILVPPRSCFPLPIKYRLFYCYYLLYLLNICIVIIYIILKKRFSVREKERGSDNADGLIVRLLRGFGMSHAKYYAYIFSRDLGLFW